MAKLNCLILFITEGQSGDLQPEAPEQQHDQSEDIVQDETMDSSGREH